MEVDTRRQEALPASDVAEATHDHWNPVEFLAQWMRHGLQHHNDRAPTDACRHAVEKKRSASPIKSQSDSRVTLYFDVDKMLTVAVLSKPTDILDDYFRLRVEQGTARQRSILYYELDGFVRENLINLRKQQNITDDCIRSAVGSLEASDTAHRRVLQEERIRQMQARHGDADEFPLYEQVMEIAREHWLNDDLDSLSVSFLGQVSSASRRIAQRIAAHRLQSLSVSVTPYLDGASLSGYSNFARSTSTSLVRLLESGQTVEYQQCRPVTLTHSKNKVRDKLGTFVPIDSESGEIAWMCEELALGNLHRWWGDIESLDYVGQKFTVSCIPPKADELVDHGQTRMILSSARLEANPRQGTCQWSPSDLVKLKIDVLNSKMKRLDDIAILYSGQARIKSVSVSFLALVQGVARRRLSSLKQELDSINQSRPLLDHELSYLRLVKNAAGST
ncbi:hypothetical protein ACA910_005883 [Epithemia clementina (nom. ined.)]